MPLIAVNEGKTVIDTDIVAKTITLMNWQLKVRRMHDPVDADNTLARLGRKSRRILGTDRVRKGSQTLYPL